MAHKPAPPPVPPRPGYGGNEALPDIAPEPAPTTRSLVDDDGATDETTRVGPMTALIAEMMLQEEDAEEAAPAGRIAARREDAVALQASRTIEVRDSAPPPPRTSWTPPPPPNLSSRPPPSFAPPAMRDSMPTPPRSVPVSRFPVALSETTADELYLMRKRRAPVVIVIGAAVILVAGIVALLVLLQ